MAQWLFGPLRPFTAVRDVFLLSEKECVGLVDLNIPVLDPSTPNAKEVQRVLFKFEREDLAPYETSSLRLSMDMYDNLPLPWDVKPAITAFAQDEFIRHEWDRDGVLTDGKDFFGGRKETSLEELEKGMATASMVTRWRVANPELVGTENDVIQRLMRDLREALGGRESFAQGSGTALLLFKKST